MLDDFITLDPQLSAWAVVPNLARWNRSGNLSRLGWGEEDLELAYRLRCSGVDFVYPHRRLVAAYHVDHPVDWEKNLASLRRNLAYFGRKFPEGYRARLPLLRYYLRELGISDDWVGVHES